MRSYISGGDQRRAHGDAHRGSLRPGLRPASARLTALLEALAHDAPPVLAVEIAADASVHVVWANPAAEQWLDEAPAQARKDGAALAVAGEPADRPDYWTDRVAALIAAGAADDTWHTATLERTSNLVSLIRVRVTPVIASTMYLVWLRPVSSETVIAEEAAAEAQHRLTVLGESAPIGVLVSELGARLSYVNDAYGAITGRESAELIGTGWLDTVAEDDMATVLAALDDVLSGDPVETTIRMYAKDFSTRWVRLRLSPVRTRQRSAGFVGTAEDITARRERESQLSYQATHDPLTGLVNRRRLLDMLKNAYAQEHPDDSDVALLFCDLDGFKAINDEHGHEAGDRVLIEMAKRLSMAARDHDIVSRLAGDEFVIVLRQIGDISEAQAAATRHLVALTRPVNIGRSRVSVRVSVGIALLREHPDAAALLRAADARMYRAKRDGGGLVHTDAGTADS